MNNTLCRDPFVLFFILVSVVSHAFSQNNLDIEGPALIKGNLSLRTEKDAFSLHLGLAAGISTFFNDDKYNTFIGSFSGSHNFVGDFNTFVGSLAGLKNSNGSLNTFLGALSGGQNTLGTANTIMGANAGSSNSDGDENTFMGAGAGRQSNGNYNSFIGFGSGIRNTSGSNNVALGHRAAEGNVAGSGNTLIGFEADVLGSNRINATALGNAAKVDASNKVRIGNEFVTKIEGQVNFTTGSDRRFKSEIEPLSIGLNFIMDLQPVSYYRRLDKNKKEEWGIIAQDLLSTLQSHGQENSGMVDQAIDDRYYVRYNDLLAPIINAIQELKRENIRLQDQVNEQQETIRKISSTNH